MTSFFQSPLSCLQNLFYHPTETSSESPIEVPTTHEESEIDELQNQHSDSTITPVKALDGSYKNIPLDVLLRLIMITKTKDYENLAQEKYKTIEGINKKIKSIDSALNKITNILNDTKSLDLTKGDLPKLVQELEKLGVEIPKSKKMSFEQASSFIRTLENKRDEHDRDMKLGSSKFQETIKDLESIRQVLLQMQTYLRDAIIKITSGLRGS